MASFRCPLAGPQARPSTLSISGIRRGPRAFGGFNRKPAPLACAASTFLASTSSRITTDASAALDQALQRLSAMYFLADVSTNSISAASDTAAAAVAVSTSGAAPAVQRAGGWVAPLADALEQVLYVLQEGLDKIHVPYSYGYSIILLTLIVKILTFPLIKQQVESTMAVQALKPRIDLIRDRFGDDKDKIQKETSLLYEQAGVNPLAGCLPTLATIPIFIGLYSSLTNVANEGLLDTQGFYWIPSLAGPTTIAMRQSGLGTSWLLPLGPDGAPPIGWPEATAYLSLPVLLVLMQYISSFLTTPPIDPKDENANTQRALLVGLPLMIGWFSLNVPSGLSLYYLSNTVLSTAQQVYLKKLGGAKVVINELGPVTKPGSGRRTGVVVNGFKRWVPTTVMTTAEAAKAKEEAERKAEAEREAYDDAAASGMSYTDSVDGGAGPATALAAATLPSPVDSATISRRCKRRRLTSLMQDGSGYANGVVAPAKQVSPRPV